MQDLSNAINLKDPLAKSNLEKGLFNIFFITLAVLFAHEDCA